jgi:hypothetical protein
MQWENLAPDVVQSKYSNSPFHRELRPVPGTCHLLILRPSMTDNQGQSRQKWGDNTVFMLA